VRKSEKRPREITEQVYSAPGGVVVTHSLPPGKERQPEEKQSAERGESAHHGQGVGAAEDHIERQHIGAGADTRRGAQKQA